MTMLLFGIAGVSLLVGGIGIMNIMLVSVTERTREIGVRMALGARRRRILIQFLFESVTLSALGGLLGVLLGAGAAVLAREVFTLPASIPAWAVLLSLFSASGAGLLFGIYPAARASGGGGVPRDRAYLYCASCAFLRSSSCCAASSRCSRTGTSARTLAPR